MEGRVTGKGVCAAQGRCCNFWNLPLAGFPFERPGLIFASCHEFRICIEMHIVEEKEWLEPFGSCDVDGQGDSSGKPNHCLLLAAVYSNESVTRVYKPSVARIKGPPQAFFLVMQARLIAKPTQTTASVLRRDTCVWQVVLWFQKQQLDQSKQAPNKHTATRRDCKDTPWVGVLMVFLLVQEGSVCVQPRINKFCE